jgi:hypothetical protein
MKKTGLKIKKETRGGKREGSGRKKGEPTKTLSYRVPVKKSAKIDNQIRELIKSLYAKTIFNLTNPG